MITANTLHHIQTETITASTKNWFHDSQSFFVCTLGMGGVGAMGWVAGRVGRAGIQAIEGRASNKDGGEKQWL